MNADDLNKLPRYIEVSGGGMLLLPADFLATTDNVFVRLLDVKAIYDAAAIKYFGEFASVNFPAGVPNA